VSLRFYLGDARSIQKRRGYLDLISTAKLAIDDRRLIGWSGIV